MVKIHRKNSFANMARRHRHLIGYRILLIIVIPSMYFIFLSLAGSMTKKEVLPVQESFLRTRKLLQINESEISNLDGESNCTSPAIKEFPSDGLTRQQRQHGLLIVHLIIAIYCFILLAVVCDDFFVPAITKICEKLDVSKDVAGATFMAAASSSPELFINIVGTFVTEGDLGIGTIVGSAVFNILAVPACCGLFAFRVLKLEWWPISRDSLAYGVTVLLLILTLHDGRIEWYEALILVIFYILYIMAMIFNSKICKCLNLIIRKRHRKYRNLSEESPLLGKDVLRESFLQSKGKETFFATTNLTSNGKNIYPNLNGIQFEDIETLTDESLEIVNMTSWPESTSERLWWLFTWPINFILLITIPDCRRPSLRNWYPLTFIMCMVYLASISYIVGWDITIIGDTLMIPDSVMGLTFLAAGMSVPEAVSSIIVTNQGHGTMGISNSIGSNVFDVLLCLGFPWFVKAAFLPTIPGQNFIRINSEGLIYSSISLFSSLVVLYATLAFNRFKLDRKVGIMCLVTYIIFLVIASLIELNVFFVVNRPTCDHY